MRRDQNISRRYILRYYAAGIASIGFGLGCILVNMSWQDRDTVKNKNIGTMEAMYGVGIASAWFGLACIVKISRTIEGYLKFTLELKQAAIEYNQVCHQVAIDVKNVIGNINQSVENANSAMRINQILAPTLFLRRRIKFPPRITEEWNALLQETVSADFYSLSEKDSRSPKKIREAARFLEEYRYKVTGLGVTVLEDIEEFIIGGVATILSGGEVLLAVGLGMVGGVIGGFVGKKIEEKIERVQEGNNNNQAARRELQEGAIEIEAIEIEAPNENVPQQQRMLRLRCSGGRLFAIPVAHEAEVRGDEREINRVHL